MLKYLVYFILILNFGCITQRRCNDLFPPIVKDSIVVLVKDSIVIKDTTIYIKADTITLIDSIDCKDFFRVFNSARVKVKVVIKNKIITVQAICTEVEAKLKIYEYWHKKIENRTHTELRTTNKKTKFMIFKDWFFWIIVSFILGFITFKILKFYKKLPF